MSAAFDAVAGGYDGNDEHARIAGALIGLMAPGAGLAVDVATGTGTAAFAAIAMLPRARVAAIDISGGMLRVAQQRAVAQDPDRRIRWLRGGALPLPAADSSVDLVLCASSLHFLGPEALRDWQRVLRAGGQAAFSLPARSSFRPSPQFRRLLPAAGIQLPETAGDAGQLLDGSGLTLRRAAGLTLGGEGRRVVLVVAGKE